MHVSGWISSSPLISAHLLDIETVKRRQPPQKKTKKKKNTRKCQMWGICGNLKRGCGGSAKHIFSACSSHEKRSERAANWRWKTPDCMRQERSCSNTYYLFGVWFKWTEHERKYRLYSVKNKLNKTLQNVCIKATLFKLTKLNLHTVAATRLIC